MTAPSSVAELRVTAGPAKGATVRLDNELFVGCAASGAGRLGDDPALSIRHARILPTVGGSVLVVDLGATEGTWVKGDRVSTRELAVGDVVRFGGTTLELVAGPARADAEAGQDSE